MDLFSLGSGLMKTAGRPVRRRHAANQRAVSGAIASRASFPPPARPASQVAPARQQMIDNADAVNALMRRALLVQAASMVGEMTCRFMTTRLHCAAIWRAPSMPNR